MKFSLQTSTTEVEANMLMVSDLQTAGWTDLQTDTVNYRKTASLFKTLTFEYK